MFPYFFFWNIIGWSLHLAWEPNELPGGMTKVWRLMIKCIGTIMNYLWDASTSVECTRMTKRQAHTQYFSFACFSRISFRRSLILSILLQVTAPCFISKLVFQCFPVPISETGRILWDVDVTKREPKRGFVSVTQFSLKSAVLHCPIGPSENPSPRHAGCGKQDGAHHLCWYLDFC